MKYVYRALIITSFCLYSSWSPILSVKKSAYAKDDTITLKGYLKAPGSLQHTPPFRIFFQGMSTVNDREGFFTLPVTTKKPPTKLYLLLCSRANLAFENINTVKHIAIDPHKHHAFYKMYKKGKTEWNIKEVKLEKKAYILPQHCLLILINPAYIESVVPWKLSLGKNIVTLPQIILKDTIIPEHDLTSEEKRIGKGTLMRASRKSMLYALDLKVFHQEIPTHTQNKGSLSVA